MASEPSNREPPARDRTSEGELAPARRVVWQATLMASGFGGLLLGTLYAVAIMLPLATSVYHDFWPVGVGGFVGLIFGLLMGLSVGTVALLGRWLALSLSRSPLAESIGAGLGTLLGSSVLYAAYLGHSDLNFFASASLFIALPSVALATFVYVLSRLPVPAREGGRS